MEDVALLELHVYLKNIYLYQKTFILCTLCGYSNCLPSGHSLPHYLEIYFHVHSSSFEKLRDASAPS